MATSVPTEWLMLRLAVRWRCRSGGCTNVAWHTAEKDGGRRWLVRGRDVEGARRGSSATRTARGGNEAVSSPRQLTTGWRRRGSVASDWRHELVRGCDGRRLNVLEVVGRVPGPYTARTVNGCEVGTMKKYVHGSTVEAPIVKSWTHVSAIKFSYLCLHNMPVSSTQNSAVPSFNNQPQLEGKG